MEFSSRFPDAISVGFLSSNFCAGWGLFKCRAATVRLHVACRLPAGCGIFLQFCTFKTITSTLAKVIAIAIAITSASIIITSPSKKNNSPSSPNYHESSEPSASANLGAA